MSETKAVTKDPVCGMTIDPETAIHVNRDGKRSYFCSERCRRRFLSQPATSRVEVESIGEGDMPLPEELTGRASGTDESLTALFGNGSAGHLADGFRGGSNADRDVAIPRAHEPDPETEPS